MNSQIERTIANGKPLAIIKKLLREEFIRLDKAKFEAELRDEYELKFPKYRDANEDEIYEQQEHYLNNASNEVLLREDIDFSEFIYSQVEIDYSQDEAYKTLEEYKNETRVITEAVEATYDEEGNVLTEAIPEVTELVRPYVGLSDEVIESKVTEYINSKYAELRANAYPPIEEQLDMQYKDSLDGGTRFKDAIEAVKLKYPKA
jgi:hypothetical protein